MTLAAEAAPTEARLNYKPQTQKELLKTNFAIWNRDPELRAAQIEAYTYIDRMASLAGTDISKWDLLEVFSLGDSEYPEAILTEQRAINVRMSAYEDQLLRSVPVELKSLDLKVTSEMQGLQDSIIQERIKVLESSVKDNLRRAKEYDAAMQQSLLQARNHRLEQDKLTGNKRPNLGEEVQKILAGGFFVLDKQPLSESSQTIRFNTRGTVTLTQKQPQLGINFMVNMGRYLTQYHVREARFSVYGLEGNVQGTGHVHPYVSASGAVCWGNGSALAQEHISSGRIFEAMNLLQGLLTTYSTDSSPYVSLDRFQAAYNQTIPRELQPSGTSGLGPFCPGCDHEEDNCSCDRCRECEALTDDCECNYCERCDVQYREGSNCGGNVCSRCHTCFGQDYCDNHHCSVCDNYVRYPSECCCVRCESAVDECTCCGECSSTDENCSRCRQCGTHDEHDTGCTNQPQQTEREER